MIMAATVSPCAIHVMEPRVNLLFLSPVEKRAQKLAARLRTIATVHWENSTLFSTERWARWSAGQQLVLLDYEADSAASSTALVPQLLALSPTLPLLGVGSAAGDRGHGVLAALRAGGIDDYLDLDAGDEEIRALLERAEHLQAIGRHAAQGAPTPHKRGQLILVMGVRAGIGASTLAAHLGTMATPAATTDTTAPHALLVELGQPSGDVELYLGLSSDFHYHDALRSAERIDATLIHTALPHHRSGLVVLAQARGADPVPGDTSANDVLVERLLGAVDLLICDLGGLTVPQIPSAFLRAANAIWLVADQGVASLLSLDTSLNGLDRLQARDDRLGLVINRYDVDCGLSAQQIAKRFHLPLLATLPERSRTLRASINQGSLLHQVAPRDPYIRALTPLLARLPTGSGPARARSAWQELTARLRGHQ